MISFGFLVFASITGAGFFLIWSKMSSLDPNHKKKPTQAAEKTKTESLIGPIYPLDPFIVNLADPGGKRYLRTSISLEIKNGENKNLKEEMDKRLPQVKDIIVTLLPTRKFDDIQTVEGKLALRDELMQRLNKILTQGKVTNIYFTEFVVQ